MRIGTVIQPDAWYTVKEAHTLIYEGKLGRTTLYKLINGGKLPSYKVGGKVLLRGSDLLAFQAQSQVQQFRQHFDTPAPHEEVGCVGMVEGVGCLRLFDSGPRTHQRQALAPA